MTARTFVFVTDDQTEFQSLLLAQLSIRLNFDVTASTICLCYPSSSLSNRISSYLLVKITLSIAFNLEASMELILLPSSIESLVDKISSTINF